MKKLSLMHKPYKKSQQSGAVLALCLIFLTALTVTAVGGMETTIMEERMASNMQDYNIAFQAAEASLEVAEVWLQNQIFQPSTSDDGTTRVWGPDNLGQDGWWQDKSRDWWETFAFRAEGLSGVASQPEYIIEEYFTGYQGNARNEGSGVADNGRIYHRVTARGMGGSSTSQVMLQTTYVRPYE